LSDRGVDPGLVAWNRVVLLHGPPGTGKTSLCHALAHKLSVRLSGRFAAGQLVEVNAHSLFSKWFSESGKLVTRLFGRIQEMVEERDVLVFVLIDEVESLTAARRAAAAGSEPSDAIRAVNALLTQLDALRRHPNVMLLTTSNITEAVDLAFVDRADIKAFVGHPPPRARYEILRSGVEELQRVGVLADGLAGAPGGLPGFKVGGEGGGGEGGEPTGPLDAARAEWGAALRSLAERCDGFSGRLLRKLPFLALVRVGAAAGCTTREFLRAMGLAVSQELQDRADLTSG